MNPEAKSKFMNVRVPPAMLEALRKEAEENTRTLASQILHILKLHLESKR